MKGNQSFYSVRLYAVKGFLLQIALHFLGNFIIPGHRPSHPGKPAPAYLTGQNIWPIKLAPRHLVHIQPPPKKKTWFPFIPLLPCDDGSEIAIFQAGHLRGQHPRNLPHWLVLWFGPPRDPKVLGAPSKVNPEIPTVFIGQNGGIHEPMVI